MAANYLSKVVYPQFLQAGILKSSGRLHTGYILCQLEASGTVFRSFLRSFLREWPVTSHGKQLQDTDAYNRSLFSAGYEYREKTQVNIGFSYSGLKMLEVDDLDIPTDRAFRRGLASLGQDLAWYPSDQKDPYDVMSQGPFEAIIVLSNSRQRVLAAAIRRVIEVLENSGVLAQRGGKPVKPAVEYGVSVHGLRRIGGSGPLGYQDGLSEKRTPEEVARIALLREEGYLLENVENREAYAFGSLMFYQKIKLNHAVFTKRINEIANHPNFKGGSDPVALAEALLMGRFKNGTPLIFTQHGNSEDARLYRDAPFDYMADPLGKVCPFNAHTRVVNPRNLGPAGAEIVRRGTFYGNSLGADPKAQVEGLHFVSLQKSLQHQLIPILRRIQQAGSFDPIAYGKNSEWEFTIPKEFLKNQELTIIIKSRNKISEYIGGGFFYIPSLTALERFSSG